MSLPWRRRGERLGDAFADPFADSYFTDALRAAADLRRARAHDTVAHYEIVRQLDGPHATVLVGRRPDGRLLALKGFAADGPTGPGSRAIRESEALRMMRFGFGGVVPLEETLSLTSGGPVTYLCMPYCQGGSLRDRVTAGRLGAAELAYHGLALAAALQRLHQEGLIHGDVKPDNLLFHHGDDGLPDGPARWHTWLSDLESQARVGEMVSRRMTPEYAAPEQRAGAPAAPAMDVWAWGATLRDCLADSGPLPVSWRWLTELVERAAAAEPTDRPSAAQVLDTYAGQVGFGDHQRPVFGAPSGTAVACYPLASMPPFADPWTSTDDRVHVVRASFGWAAYLPECERLYSLNTFPALTRLAELSTRILGDPADPASVWRAFRQRPAVPVFPIDGDGAITLTLDGAAGATRTGIPRQVALTFVRLLVTARVELVEATGAERDVERLRAAAEAWEAIGEFGSEADTAVLAQAWLTLDRTDRALPYVIRAQAKAPDAPSTLAALRLYHLVSGDHAMAARVSMEGCRTADGPLALRWLLLAVVDLLEAAEYEALDGTLAQIEPGIDVVELVRLVAAGRRAPVGAEALWPDLRRHFKTLSSTASTLKLRYLAEAAYQRGDLTYARRCATVILAWPETRLPVNHQARAAIEAIALDRDPADRSLTARLNNRAELWSADGRPDDPLLGLGLVAATRWASGSGSDGLSPAALALIEHSRSRSADRSEALLGSARPCARCREPGRVAQLAVCGRCHQLLCARCALTADQGHTRRCGGDLAHPPSGLGQESTASLR
ncbi:hypothetical protein KCMC57_up47220 [Kitasatospora sp. CMC57]|uniref:Protein kinase domain-containing protein n=1 Tax=Kitasatospora sp. CMC57 TaxID=3231513 RepID=A0AB33JYU8_9ACTN